MNRLRPALRDYLTLRRDMGFKFQAEEKRLAKFVTFMEERRAPMITYKLAIEWATQPADRHATWTLRLTDIRGFARYLQGIGVKSEIPPTWTLPGLTRSKPYIYTEAEVRRLLAAALALPPRDALRRWTYYNLLGLLAVTGLRISEALSLRCEDVDLEAGVLTIRSTKFGKSRLVPLHHTTVRSLASYVKQRDAHVPRARSPFFFVAERGGKLLLQYVYRVFWRLSQETGLRKPAAHTGPRLHDFRHRFAVQTLLSWYRSGQKIELLLPLLSTYLGHTTVRDTYWYLSACPELMEHAARRLESYQGGAS
jgi:integrase